MVYSFLGSLKIEKSYFQFMFYIDLKYCVSFRSLYQNNYQLTNWQRTFWNGCTKLGTCNMRVIRATCQQPRNRGRIMHVNYIIYSLTYFFCGRKFLNPLELSFVHYTHSISVCPFTEIRKRLESNANSCSTPVSNLRFSSLLLTI